jgi:hypothetical protein
MRWMRCTHEGRARLGRVEGDAVLLHEGDLFGAPQATGEQLPLADVRWLPPCQPGQIVGLWNNFRAAAAKNGWAEPAEPLVFLAQRRVGIPGVGIFIEGLGVGMGGGGIEVVVAVLHVLAVISLIAAQTEQTLFENCIAAIPQRRGEAELALAIAPSLQTVFPPAIGTETGVIVRYRRPAIAVIRKVLPHRSPLPLAEVRAPAFPVRPALAIFH